MTACYERDFVRCVPLSLFGQETNASPMRVCLRCGKLLGANTSRCPHCGLVVKRSITAVGVGPLRCAECGTSEEAERRGRKSAPAITGACRRRAPVVGRRRAEPQHRRRRAATYTAAYQAVQSADLVLTKTGALNGVATWTLSVRNQGPGAAEGVVVTDTLPSRVSYVSAPGCT
jgi:uncharacterized repeat protein (TIGR01451 family)